MRTTYWAFQSGDLAAIQRLDSATATIAPTWLHSLRYEYGGPATDRTVAAISIDMEYRQATISIYEAFFDRDRSYEDRLRSVAHERFHLFVQPIADVAREILKSGFQDETGPFRKLGGQQITKAVEAAVQDMTDWWMETQRMDPTTGEVTP